MSVFVFESCNLFVVYFVARFLPDSLFGSKLVCRLFLAIFNVSMREKGLFRTLSVRMNPLSKSLLKHPFAHAIFLTVHYSCSRKVVFGPAIIMSPRCRYGKCQNVYKFRISRAKCYPQNLKYSEIYPESLENPSGSAMGISLGLSLYFTVYPSYRVPLN